MAIEEQQPDPEKRLAYGPVLCKGTAEKMGVDTTSVVEDTTGKNPFSNELAKALKGSELEEELLRFCNNKGMRSPDVKRFLTYMKKNKLKVSEPTNWTVGYKGMMKEDAPSPLKEELLAFCDSKGLNSTKTKKLLTHMSDNKMKLNSKNWNAAHDTLFPEKEEKLTNNDAIVKSLTNIRNGLNSLIEIFKQG
jgi:hypothetical protein